MAAVSENIVREYFELHDFFVRQPRKYIDQTRREQDDDIDFFVVNLRPRLREGGVPFVLSSSEMAYVERAVVVVKGWHTETFSTAVLAHAPRIFRFVEPKMFRQAAGAFGKEGRLLKILVAPALPSAEKARQESVELMRSKGVDAVLPFRTMLDYLVRHVEVNRNYQKSDLLQMIRIFKNYGFFKEPQLELFKVKGKRR